jgi:hypothetical protein
LTGIQPRFRVHRQVAIEDQVAEPREVLERARWPSGVERAGRCDGHERLGREPLTCNAGKLGRPNQQSEIERAICDAAFEHRGDVELHRQSQARARGQQPLASPKGGKASADPRSEEQPSAEVKAFLADKAAMTKLNVTQKVSDLKGKYDANFVAGGHGTMWDLSTDPQVAHRHVCHRLEALRALIATNATGASTTLERSANCDARASEYRSARRLHGNEGDGLGGPALLSDAAVAGALVLWWA